MDLNKLEQDQEDLDQTECLKSHSLFKNISNLKPNIENLESILYFSLQSKERLKNKN